MQLHQLTTTKLKSKKRIGRGGKRGTYSGRGGKGQTARAGARVRPAIRDFIQKVHKLRGVPGSRYKKQGSSVSVVTQIVNFSDLDKKYSDGEIVSIASLSEKGMIKKLGRKTPSVKILGKGELAKDVKFEGVLMSRRAEKMIKNNK